MPEPEKLYELVRAKIVHEDDLVNQRLTWTITLNGLLFTAFGFSLTADAASIAGLTNASSIEQYNRYNDLKEILTALRTGIAAVGIASALIALLGVVAAFRAIAADSAFLAAHLRAAGTAGEFPRPLGLKSTSAMGMLCGLLVPWAIAAAWLGIQRWFSNPLYASLLGASLALALVASLWPVFRNLESQH